MEGKKPERRHSIQADDNNDNNNNNNNDEGEEETKTADDDNDDEQQRRGGGGESVKVFLRLRPMNKLEESKRSKDCIELHDNPKIVTVDSPLQGVFDFTFDMVFDEYASQAEVYKESLADIPTKLINGVNCAILAYGQTGTGKSHTMMGEGNGSEMNLRAQQQQQQQRKGGAGDMEEDEAGGYSTTTTLNPEVEQDLDITEGMVARVVKGVFEKIKKLPPSVEVSIRCSYVELYLEKFKDLLQPSKKGIRVGDGEDGEFCLLGASELCCVTAKDVFTLLARGNAFRNASATTQNYDLRRSNAVFSLQIHLTDHDNGTYTRSKLYMLDLAGSEMGRTKSSRQENSPSNLEARMVSASLQSVYTYIRSKLTEQGKEKARIHPNAYANVSKLARLLKPCLGGNFHTTFICTASPSSYNIGETINTIKFGQKVKILHNFPKPCQQISVQDYRIRLSVSERHATNLTRLVKVLAQECRTLRKTGKVRQPTNNKVWDAISKIAKSGDDDDDDDGSDLHIEISKRGEERDDNNNEEEKKDDMDEKTFTSRLQEMEKAREKAENSARESQSEIYTLKSQLDLLTKEKQRVEKELNETKEELQTVNSRKHDLEHRLRTSQYREMEAIVFLRQFRTFYVRLLKSRESHGNGSTSKIIDETIASIPGGPPNLSKLLDVDRLMLDSGLIEKEEVGEDSNSQGYAPSEEALSKSAKEAEKAEDRELVLIKEKTGTSESILRSSLESGQIVTYRQKLVTSPAGKLAMQQERELERQVLELSHKVVGLQNSVNAEKAMVEALSSRQGALGNMKRAQEMNILKTELERKSNDLQAIVWKMNELHLVNKTIDGKLEHRENHVAYLEDHLEGLRTKNRQLEEGQLELQKKLREESFDLKQQLDGITLKLWQLGESPHNIGDIWRYSIPCYGEPADLNTTTGSAGKYERRSSIGALAEEAITFLENPERPETNSCSTQTVIPVAEMATQTETAVSEICVQTDEHSRLHSFAIEISTQTDPKPTKNIRVQTEPPKTVSIKVQTEKTKTKEIEVQTEQTKTKEIEVQTEHKETNEMEVQTEIAETNEMQVQTETAETNEMQVQTDEAFPDEEEKADCVDMEVQTDGEFKPVMEGKEISVQTDEEEGTKETTSPTVSEISTQTDFAVENDPPPLGEETIKQSVSDITTQEVATQTDDLPPNEISLVETGSTDSLDLDQQKGVNEVFKSSSERWSRHHPKPTKSFDSYNSSKHFVENNAAAEQEEESSVQMMFHNSTSSMGSFGANSATEFSGYDSSTAAKKPVTQLSSSGQQQNMMDPKLGSSMPAIHSSVDWRSKAKQQQPGKESAAPQTPRKDKFPKASVPRPPLSHGSSISQATKSPGRKKISIKKDSTPEWLSKFKEMGIVGDENEGGGEGAAAAAAAGAQRNRPRTGSKKPPKSKSISHVNFPYGNPSPKSSSSSSRTKSLAETPEWMSKFKAMGIKADENEPDEDVGPAPPAPPEWISKFKEMGIKTDDEPEVEPEPVVEAPPPKPENEPEWKKQFKKIGMKGEEVIVEAPPPPPPPSKQKGAKPPPPPETPEWMQRFKKMGIDGGEAK